MKVIVRQDESGVSEVVGTIMILAITVVLFSVVILWVSSIPTPTAQTRLDVQSSLFPVYQNGIEKNDILNLTNMGGEALDPSSTIIYITHQRGSTFLPTDNLRLHLFKWNGAHTEGDGLIDGTDAFWNAGERWQYQNSSMKSTDTTTVTIVDLGKGIVLWTSTVTPPMGSRPPVFVNVWANRYLNAATVSTPVTGAPIFIFAQVMDPDGDLNVNSVYANLTILPASNPCSVPQKMYDDGTNGDQTPHDGIFTLARTSCLNPDLTWDGSLVLFNATDNAKPAHVTTTRLTLHVVLGPTGGGGSNLNGTSGRPPNLLWNGNQGYNLFNLTQWSQFQYNATATRNFVGSDTVVLVVGSLTLEDLFGKDAFYLWDPLSGSPSKAVVYLSTSSTQTVGLNTLPSSTQALTFFQFVNGYYIYIFEFKLNDPTVGTNFYSSPSYHPPYYVYGRYALSIQLMSSTGEAFASSDSINITATPNTPVKFPTVQTFSDPGFTHPSTWFRSTSVMYVQVGMNTVDSAITNVNFGNVIIQDFSGGSQLFRAPMNGYQANLPICPVTGSCSSGATAITIVPAPQSFYRFAVNLSRVNQDPWVPGNQSYSFVLSSIKDTDESYSNVATQVHIQSPLYKMDVIVGTADTTSSAWGSHDYAYFYENVNGVDWWTKNRLDYCASSSSLSGLTGSSNACPSPSNVRVALGDLNNDGTLDVAESIYSTQGSVVAIFTRTVDMSGNIIYVPKTIDPNPPQKCSAIKAGDVTGDGIPDIVCGGINGNIWYYKNNGNWTRIMVDSSTTLGTVNTVAIADFTGDGANDIAAGGANGLKWYPNLDRLGTFSSNTVSSNNVAIGEKTVLGTVVSGNAFSTTAQDGVSEQIREGLISIPQVTGANLNGGFDTSAGWTGAAILQPVTETYQSTGGNGTGYGQIQTGVATSQIPAGYFWEPFTVSGSTPYSVTLAFDYELTQNGATANPGVTFSVFVDATSGIPITSQAVSTVTVAQGVTKGWTHLNAFQNRVLSQVTGPGTYYLKVAMYTSCGVTACTTTTGGFDNVQLSWYSTQGSASALAQYYNMSKVPNRLGSNTVTIYVEANRSANSEGDNFVLAWSSNVIGNDPTTGTYTNFTWINNTVMPSPGPVAVSLTTAQIAQVLGKYVWIRVLDTNRTVGGISLDSVFVDAVYITVLTQAIPPGYALTTDGTAVNSINAAYVPPAGSTTPDPYADLVAGTSGGKVYVYDGSAGGLIQRVSGTPYFAASGGSVVGVRFGNITGSSSGLNIVVLTGSYIQIIPGWFGGAVPSATYTLAVSSYTSYTPMGLAVGDINGDGWDDVVFVTGTASGGAGSVVFIENLGRGAAWYNPAGVVDSFVGATVYSVAIGDTSNALYQGR